MRRPGTPTPVLVGDTTASTTIKVNAGRGEVPFELDHVSATGGRIRGELTLTVGQQIWILLTLDNVEHAIDAEVVAVRVTPSLSEEADVRFLSVVPEDVSAYLAANEDVDFDHEEEQPTQRRSAPLLPALEDLDPPTLRKNERK